MTVVGGGFGGLSAACYLANAGADVQLLERYDRLGGHAGVLERDGFRFDTGPSWYLMPDVFERFFKHFDREPADYYELERLDPQYRVFWKDGDRVTMRPNRENAREVFESYEEGPAMRWPSTSTGPNRTRPRNGPGRLRGPRTAPGLRRPRPAPARTAGPTVRLEDDYVSRYIDHPYVTGGRKQRVLGGAPHNTPALYSIMSHVRPEHERVLPRRRHRRRRRRPRSLARELGVDIQTGTEVQHIAGEAGAFELTTEDGVVASDVVVSDANPAYTEQHCLTPLPATTTRTTGTTTYAPRHSCCISVSRATWTRWPTTRWSCRRTGTAISSRYSTARRGPTTPHIPLGGVEDRRDGRPRRPPRHRRPCAHRAGAGRRPRDSRGIQSVRAGRPRRANRRGPP